ncbi:S8 family serine peptidase [Lacimicrobium alkaliphilum]|uniref:PKD domain-containing protein n=1 Tax=Lacimicrobium alkaliphilum TaxID=1526571 RepID=A0ABQ1RRD3_9ALTE|nr:S8 family serine peptidase [Lacimicrobium alkaliphilum]GGD79016.1 hypothetical protein GCM10011357_37530 [Lacimicrobium alkaliphilum]
MKKTIYKHWLVAGLALALIPLGQAWAEARLLSTPAEITVADQYIVVLKPQSSGLQQTETFVTQQARSAVAATQGTVSAEFHHALQGYAITTDEQGLNTLLAQDNVDYIEPVQIFRLNAVQNNPTWGLDRIDQQDRPLDNSYRHDYSAAGINAYVIDTGINTSHVQFSGRIGSTITTIGNSPEDCNGHGTHVAGTIGSTTYGVAKQVTLHSVKVFGCSGETTSTAIIQGIDWVAGNATLPAVANMSLGGGASTALDQATNRLIQSGVSTVVAAGNDNANACQYSPARVSAAITVGSTTSSDSRSNFSNWGSCVDIFAPGSSIQSTWIGGSNATNSISGTSMASPHVAGVAALYLDKNGSSSPASVAQALYTNAATGKISGTNGSVNRLVNTEFLEGGGNQNTPPQASFSVSQNGLTVSLTDTSTDDQGVVSWNWSFGDGSSDTAQDPVHSYAQSGTYTISLTVADQQGLQSTTSQSVTVSDGTGNGCNGVPAWSATTSYQSGDNVSYNGRLYTATWWSTGARPDVFSNVWQDQGPCGNGTNQPPVADFSHSASELTVSFSDQSTDDSGVVSWNWNFGDNQSSTSANPTHQYAQAGNYSVELTVEDAEGLSHSVTKLVSVSDNNQGCGGLPAWNSSSVYTGGDQVQYNNNKYRAKWWSQGDNPEQNSGTWDVWENLGACN